MRVVVLLGGAVVDERIVRTPTLLRIGRSARCEIVVPSEDVPDRWPLFSARRGRWLVTPLPGVRARVSEGERGAIEEVAAARVLGEATRGKLVAGELTVLFQRVVAPPPPVRPALPAALQLRLRDRVDPYMAAVAVFSIVAHGAAVGWISGIDTPRAAEAAEVPDRYVRQPILRLPPPLVVAPAAAAVTTPATSAPAVPAAPAHVPAAVPTPVPTRPEDALAVLDVLGSAGKEPGRFHDVTGGKTPGNLAAGIDRATRDGLALATPDGRAPRDGTHAPTIGAGHDAHVNGPRDVLASTRGPRGSEDDPRPHVDLPRPPAGGDDGGLDASAVYDKIRRVYFGAVQKCYEDVLKHDGERRGRVDVTLTIGGRGQVVAVSASGFDASLDRCIEADARRWRFSAPAESDGDTTTLEFPFSFSPSR